MASTLFAVSLELMIGSICTAPPPWDVLYAPRDDDFLKLASAGIEHAGIIKGRQNGSCNR